MAGTSVDDRSQRFPIIVRSEWDNRFVYRRESLMTSVTQRINGVPHAGIPPVKQPRGGYINPKRLTAVELEGPKPALEQKKESVSANLVGSTVDYLTRFMEGVSVKEAFKISFLGADIVGESANAIRLAEGITGLDDASIANACKLVGYDSAYRAGLMAFRPVEDIEADGPTCENIRTMVNLSLGFFREYGPVTRDGITFEGGYTDLVNTGDGDFMTADAVWDFKVSVKPPTNKHTLQIVMYWLLGMHSVYAEDYKAVKRLGFFNPRLGMVYTIDVADLDREMLREIEVKVIGYDSEKAIF